MHHKRFLAFLFTLILSPAGMTPALAAPAQPGPASFSENFDTISSRAGNPSGWRSISFSPELPPTRYQVAGVDGRRALRAEADGSSSFLVWEREFDPSRTPILEWEWKISGTVPQADLRVVDLEDAPARLVVLFPYDPEHEGFLERMAFEVMRQVHGEYPPARVLTYVWGNRMPRDSWIVSTYSERIRIICVESGNARAGQWLGALRNIAEDYLKYFDGPLPKRARIGIVVDTDDTSQRTVSWFDNIRLSPDPEQALATLPGVPPKSAVARRGG